MNPTTKRYIVSSAITFVAAFAGSIALQLHAGAPLDLTTSGILAILGVAGRAAVKAIIEGFAGVSGDPAA